MNVGRRTPNQMLADIKDRTKGKHVREPRVADGHVFVAGHARRETMLEDHYDFSLSRDPDGEYWITSAFGDHFIRDEENKQRGKLLQFSRGV